MMPTWALRAASVLLALDGLGFGIPCIMGIRGLASGQGIAMIMGFPAYGAGPLERAGVRSTVPLLAAFLLVCALELVAAWLVWQGERAGAILSLALLVPGALFWWGFALPFPPILALGRTALIALAWRDFS